MLVCPVHHVHVVLTFFCSVVSPGFEPPADQNPGVNQNYPGNTSTCPRDFWFLSCKKTSMCLLGNESPFFHVQKNVSSHGSNCSRWPTWNCPGAGPATGTLGAGSGCPLNPLGLAKLGIAMPGELLLTGAASVKRLYIGSGGAVHL